ncbi:hypothetical protein VTO42DRAFT_6193 [Malbranchea cinnamomea]
MFKNDPRSFLTVQGLFVEENAGFLAPGTPGKRTGELGPFRFPLLDSVPNRDRSRHRDIKPLPSRCFNHLCSSLALNGVAPLPSAVTCAAPFRLHWPGPVMDLSGTAPFQRPPSAQADHLSVLSTPLVQQQEQTSDGIGDMLMFSDKTGAQFLRC